MGRHEELALLDTALGALGRLHRRVVEVVGDPGIGKTRLLEELAGRARRRGHLVLTGQATEFERQIPFGVLVEAVDDHLASLGPAALARLDAAQLSLLATVFPSLARPGTRPVTELVEVERYRLYRAVRALSQVLADPRGLVLILDDLHWADEGSIELLDHMLRHPPEAPVLLVLAYRPRQAHRLATVLSRTARTRFATRIEVGPLTMAEADELFDPAVGRSRRQDLYRASGGNPFYLDALTRADEELPTDPLAEAGLGLTTDIPPAVHAALASELEALSPTGLLVAQAAAVAGDPFELEVAAEVAGVAEVDALAIIDDLVERDLVQPIDSSRRFRYRHPLVRKVAYQTARAGWRVVAHGRAAAALARRGAPAVARAHHVERAARLGDEAAIAVLVEAARVNLTNAPSGAAHWLRAALRLLPDEGEAAPRRLELLLALAKALGVTGRLWESRDILHDVLRLLPPGTGGYRTHAVALCAVMERLLGRHTEARALLLAELADLPNKDVPDAIALKLEIASSCFMRSDFDGIRFWAEQTLDGIQGHRDRTLYPAALGLLALSSTLVGDVQTAAEHVAKATSVIDGLSDGELVERLEVTDWLGWSEVFLERYEDALRHFTRGLALARRSGQNPLIQDLLLGQCMANGWLGRLDEAARCADDAIEVALLLSSAEIARTALACRGQINVWRGDVKAALRDVAQMGQFTGPMGEWFAGIVAGIRAQALLAEDDAEGCIAELLEAGGPELYNFAATLRPGFFGMLARAQQMLGRMEAAAAWTEKAHSAAERLGLPGGTGFALVARAGMLLEEGDPAVAAREARAASVSFGMAGMRVFQAQAQTLAAAALHASGAHREALSEFGKAKALYAACGATQLQRGLVAKQRRVGARMPRTPRAAQPVGDLEALTGRERQIAELISRGHTNREIAQQLFLSQKTVEAHVSRVFTKLGVNSRAAVAGLFARAPQPPSPRGSHLDAR